MKEVTPKSVILESLRQDLRSRDDDVRHRAILRLGEIGTDEVVSTLISVADAEPMRKIGPVSLGQPSLSGQLDALTVLSYSESDEAKRYVRVVTTPQVWKERIEVSDPMPTEADEAYYTSWVASGGKHTETITVTGYPLAKGRLRDALERRGRYSIWRRSGDDSDRASMIVSEALERVTPESNID